MLNAERINFICRVSFEAFKMPFYFINTEGDILFSYNYPSVSNPLFPDTGNYIRQFFAPSSEDDVPVIVTTKYMENFFSIPILQSGVCAGSILCGPTLQAELSGKFIDSLLADNHIPIKHKTAFEYYYGCCCKKDYSMLTQTILLVYYSLYGHQLEESKLLAKNSSFRNISSIIEKEVDAVLAENRQTYTFHHSYEHEKRLKQCIMEGDVDRLKDLIYPLDGKPGTLSRDNPIRSIKNLNICSVTLATRSAIEAGLNTEIAYTLSDLYIQKLEDLMDIKDIEELAWEMYVDFTTRVKNLKKSGMSTLVSKCQAYIFKHLYENISLSEIAKHVNMNPNYLSEVYRKQTGATLRDYILVQKVEEAKKLLDYSTLSLLEISEQLNFCNQSHFSRVFKKYGGVSPKEYRDKAGAST